MENSDIVVFAGSAIVIFGLLAGFVVFFVLLYRQTQKQHIREKAQLKLEMERQALIAQLEISEQTMKTIALEIHDNVGQVLSLAKLQLNSIEPTEAPEGIVQVHELIGRALGDLRNLSRSLSGEYITSVGLIAALEREMQLISTTGVIECSLEKEGVSSQLDPNQEVMLFRCVQEAISNAIRHSGAKHVRIIMFSLADSLAVSVQDNGKGFIGTGAEEGIGMKSMRNRMEMLRGKLTMQNAKPNGTIIRFEVPYEN